MKTDILIVGSGCSGLYAVLNLRWEMRLLTNVPIIVS